METGIDEHSEREVGLSGLLLPVAGVALVLTLLSPFVLGAGSLVGVAIGGVLAALNLGAIAFVVRGVLRGAMLSWGSLAAIKFALLLFIAWVVLKNHWAGVLPLAFGYLALPLGIVVGQLTRAAPARRQG
jgi:hypothetical protein